jgi:hypothetical protein
VLSREDELAWGREKFDIATSTECAGDGSRRIVCVFVVIAQARWERTPWSAEHLGIAERRSLANFHISSHISSHIHTIVIRQQELHPFMAIPS